MSRYVALGDSYAAGVGAGERRGWSWRTDAGYPLDVARATGLDLAYEAVLGATCADVRDGQLGRLGPETELVSITVGGNDAGFVPVLLEVVHPAWVSDADAVIDEALATIRDELPGRLQRLLAQVRAAAPGARLVVTGYPRLFNEVSDCSPFTFVTVAEMRRLTTVADALAEAVLAAADDGGADGVDVRAPFDGHQVCDDDAWLHGLSWPVPESYHPNGAGHRGYATSVLSALGLDIAAAEGVSPPDVVDGSCVGSAPGFELPDLVSPRSLRGAAACGLDPDRVARLGRAVQDDGRPENERVEEAGELQAMHEEVARG
ncbi:hypothetical protein GCM10027055_30510 [Janibacter alkaliphilus]|uniref:Lysophospholipase L1-like esterase n=1 Tax=Janibacter alkaliphilus TaxID=1069963 RepID=A0A852X0J4_9MICO|nr:lysophospholipase L1-like esterase [Janibacter alkaliphilus]